MLTIDRFPHVSHVFFISNSEFVIRSYGVMAITLDFESNNPSSNLGRTLPFLKWYFSENRWLVAYYFDDDTSEYDDETKATIRETFNKWGQETCVKMVEKSQTDSEFEYKMKIKQDSSRINPDWLWWCSISCT